MGGRLAHWRHPANANSLHCGAQMSSLVKNGGNRMRHFSVIAIVGLTLLGTLIQPARSQEPIKIGVMFPLTGPVSAQGAPERDAIKQAFDEENNTVAGRKIELLHEDSVGR